MNNIGNSDFIKSYHFPSREIWGDIVKRATIKGESVGTIVSGIISKVKESGDNAIFEYAERFDGVKLDTLRVSEAEINDAIENVSQELKEAIIIASKNISKFHEAQRMAPVSVEVMPGIKCEQRQVPIGNAGLYIPGGNSPLFSTVLMLAIPAKIAGCKRIVITTPPDKMGRVHPAILYAAHISGVTEIYKIGGAQAIAAMALGTQSVSKVNKIFGPGNRFVMEAKQQVSAKGVAIDMPAGPSEVMIIADENADVDFIATDFLSQAEHGPDSQSVLLTNCRALAEQLPEVIMKHFMSLPRQSMMLKSLANSSIILLETEDIMDYANLYAPEHLIINCDNAAELAMQVENAGSVFIGQFSPESAGDYASGTNHTLPTSGYATCFSGVNLDSFMKKITFQELSKEGLASIGKEIEIMAENEDLMAHKLAVTVRLNKLK